MSASQQPRPEKTAEQLLAKMQQAFRDVFRQFADDLQDASLEKLLVPPGRPLLEVWEEGLVCVVRPLPPANGATLTDRECEIAVLVASAYSNQAVADRLGIKRATVAAHLRRIYKKLSLRSRTELATYMVGARDYGAPRNDSLQSGAMKS